MKKFAKYILISTVLGAMVGLTHAHHAAQAQFDVDTVDAKQGVISRIRWINPHPYIYVNVTNESGQLEEWEFEAAALNVMRATGAMRTLQAGDVYAIEYWPARNGANQGLVHSLTNDQGERVFTLSLREATQ